MDLTLNGTTGSEIDAKIMAAADQVERLREQFPNSDLVTFRMQAVQILRIMGVDADIAVQAVREADI